MTSDDSANPPLGAGPKVDDGAGDPEDRRSAVNISVNLSSYLITAALAMLAVVGAFATYLLDKRETTPGFWVVLSISILAFIASIFCGGKGIQQAYSRGFRGIWSIRVGSSYFNAQAISCLLGLTAFMLLLVTTKPKQDDTEQVLRALVETLDKHLGSLAHQQQSTSAQYRELETRITELERHLDRLRPRSPSRPD